MSDTGAAAKRGLPLRVKMRHGSHFVEELAARHEAPVGKLVPLSALEPSPDQPRVDMGDLSDLVASIREKGVLEPILVRPSEQRERDIPEGVEAAASYAIIAGERRYRAALEAGLFEVPVIELDVTAEEALEIALIENLQRRDLSPFEEAEGYRALGNTHGYTQEEIARSMGKARSTIAESLSLLQIPEELRRSAAGLGVRAKSALLEIAKATDPARMKQLLERAAKQGLTRDDLRRSERERPGRRSASGERRRPYVFKFRSPDRRYSLHMSFRQSTVDRDDLIKAVEQLLEELRKSGE